MKRFEAGLYATLLIMALSSTSLAGTIVGARTNRTGTIVGARGGTIVGARNGNIAGTRTVDMGTKLDFGSFFVDGFIRLFLTRTLL